MNKGFTLIELIATIILIGVIALTASASLNKQIKNTNETSYEQFIDTLELATESYVTGRSSDFYELQSQNTPVCINLKEIVLAGYLSSKTNNPKTNNLAVDSSIVVTLNSNNQYTYTYSDNTLCSAS